MMKHTYGADESASLLNTPANDDDGSSLTTTRFSTPKKYAAMAIGVVAGLGALGTMTRTTNAGNGTFLGRAAVSGRPRLGDGSPQTLTLHAGCSPLAKLPFDTSGDWTGKIGAKVVTKSMSNDFRFEDAAAMKETSCGNYEATVDVAVGEEFGFYLYPLSDTSDESTVLDSGCMHEGDARCPAFSSPGALAGIEQCTTKYVDPGSGDVFYNRVFDGENLSFNWGNCETTCANDGPPGCPSKEPELMKFESTGTYAYTAPQTGMAKVLVVGGGGGGGGRSGAGGGGGGVVSVESYPVVAGQTYTVTVGAGGIGGSGIVNSGKNTNGHTDDDPGKPGTNSVFDNLIALGGGGGGSSWHEGGYPGGSGGGGKYGHSGGNALQSSQSGLSGSQGHGFAGGKGTSGTWNAGGGGGAGSAGQSGTSSHCGNGGSGFQSDITGTMVTYGGGGGGGSHNPACSSGGEGGAGGGGKNGMPGQKDSGTAGVNGLGGGGGGGSTTSHHGGNGGNGGSGFVAVSCCTPSSAGYAALSS